jgi:predicted PurR-regulated permease PerM
MGILGPVLAVPVAAIIQAIWTDLVVPTIKKRYVERAANGD